MTSPNMQQLIESLPKAELHVHIEGCIEVRPRQTRASAALSRRLQRCSLPCQGDKRHLLVAPPYDHVARPPAML
jgi:hypothetical protein